MPISSGGTQTARLDTAGTSLTVASVNVSNAIADPVLGIRIMLRDATVSVLSVVYGTTPAVRLAFVSGVTCRSESWYIVNPPIGTASVVITLSGPTKAVAFTTARYGVDQVDPVSVAVTSSGSSTGPTVSVSVPNTPITECLVTDNMAAQGTPTATVVTQTQEGNNGTTGSPAGGNVLGTCGQKTPTATPTAMTWLLSASGPWCMIGSYWKPTRQRISFSLAQPVTGVFGFTDISQQVIDLQNQVRTLQGQYAQLERKVQART